MQAPRNWLHWILAIRPKTLTAALAPLFVGTALAYQQSTAQDFFPWVLGVWALLATLCLQVGTNLVNDAQDFIRGTDTPARLGPIRVTQRGLISYNTVMRTAYGSFFLAFVFGLPLILKGGWPIGVVGILSLLAAYAYTAGPYPLAYHGLGELFVILFFGIVSVCGLGYLYTSSLSIDFVLAGLQVGLLCSVLLIINNARDIAEDRANNKWTTSARFGLRFARIEALTFVFSVYALHFYWLVKSDWSKQMFLPFFTLPLALFLLKKLFLHEPSPLYNKLLGMSSLLLLTFSFLLGTGFFLS